MQSVMTAIETTGVVEENRRLHLDQDLPLSEQTRVRIIVFYPPSETLFETEMATFREHMASVGYSSKDEIVDLVRQIKREQASQWQK